MSSQNLVRLQKYISECGIASRRKAEEMISQGEVTVNGKIIREMGFKVIPGKDAVKVNGKLLRTPTHPTYIALYKPAGVVTTLNDPEGRPTIKDLLIGVKDRVFPVGRLDFDSEGLLIVTNDGEYAQAVSHPKKKIRKVYKVKVKGKPQEKHIERLKMGVTLAEGKAKASHIERIRSGDQYDWYKVVLVEGKNRQVRRMFEKIGFDVLKLQRVAIGRLTLGSLDRGQFRMLTKEQAELALKD
ncbi:MAG: pseudouridine synthase [Oligoflexia bacterium]|nr:pseudouridine synthase [Oligoflexia bacterium]